MREAAVRFGSLGMTAYICMAAAIAGSFVCGRDNLILWYMLMFHSYTDIRTNELYAMPIRLGIIVETVIFFACYGLSYPYYRGLLLCLALVVLIRLLRLYAEGDMEIFIMLIMAAARKGQGIFMYSWKLVSTAIVIFSISFGIYIAVYNIIRKLKGKKFKLLRHAPMVPSIAMSFIICCVN